MSLPRHEIMPTLFQHLAWGPVRFVLRLFAGLEIRGMEQLHALRGNFILASNHTNQLDPILIVACFPFFSRHLPLVFGSREKDFYAKRGWKRLVYGGTFFKLMGAYPMYGGHYDYDAALRLHLEFARMGKSICIFPTGKQRTPHIVPKARGGVAYLAHTANLPIIPVHIQGLQDMTFFSVWTGRHKVTVSFGAPLYPKEVFADLNSLQITEDRNPYAHAAAAVMSRIEQMGALNARGTGS